jgi:hypothetical protein
MPKATDRLCFTPGPLHSEKEIKYLVVVLKTLWKQISIAHVVAKKCKKDMNLLQSASLKGYELSEGRS